MGLTVNGGVIEEEKIEREIARLRPEYTAYVQHNGGEPSETQLREWAEEDLIEEALFRQEALATQPVPSEERARQYLDGNAELFSDVPQAERLARSKEALQQRRLLKELRKGVKKPGEAEIRAYYDAHPELFVMPESVRLSHICRFVEAGSKPDAFLNLLRIKAEIDRARLDWVETLKTCSDTYERDEGLFEQVWRGDFPPEIEEKLFALKPGEVSDVIELSGRSLHLFKLLLRHPPQKLELADIQDRLSVTLFEEACRETLDAKVDALKASAVIRRES